MRWMKLIIVVAGLIGISSCCHYQPETKTLYGYGKYKDKEVEMECKPLFSDLVNIQAIKE